MKKETLEHYDRMIAWAEKQDQDGWPDSGLMYDDIGETWAGMYCHCCKKYVHNKDWICPLSDGARGCTGYCCNGLWGEMNKANTWKDWIKAAKKVRAYIKKTPLNKYAKKVTQ